MKNNFKTQFKFKMSSNFQLLCELKEPAFSTPEEDQLYTVIKKFPKLIEDLYNSSVKLPEQYWVSRVLDCLNVIINLKVNKNDHLISPIKLTDEIITCKKFLKDKELTQEVKYVIFKFKQIKDSTF